MKARNACRAARTHISLLTSEAVVKRVLETQESRECIRTQDWVQLEKEKVSWVRTNASALCALYQRCITAGLQYPNVEACGLANLRAGLRTQAHSTPLHVHKPPSLESNLGQAHPLPAPQVGPTGTHEMVSMSDVEMSAVQAPARPRAIRHTQTEEGTRRRNAQIQRRARERKRSRRQVENRDSGD